MYERPSRKRLRYAGHDYRAPCCVHVTLCTHHRQPLFGTVTATGMHLNNAGHLVLRSLHAIHSDDAGIALDAHIVMPDHIHAIIFLGTNPSMATTQSIPDVVRDFKTRVMRSWPGGVRRGHWPAYESRLLHRSYNDKLIEHQRHLEATREYIIANPGRWIERMASRQ